MALSKPELIAGQKKVLQASAAVQTYVAAILRQPDIKLAELPDLPNAQKTARQHAQVWNDQVLPAIIKTNADMIDYANGFASFYDTLVKLAEKIDAGDKSQVKIFTQGLVLLRNNLSRKDAQAKYTEIQLQDFRDKISVDHKNFNEQADAATKALAGTDGKLKEISSQIDAINEQINSHSATMAAGGVAMVGGVLMIMAGSFTFVPTGGASSGLIVAGTGVLVGGIGAELTGGIQYGFALEKKKDLQEELATEKQGIGILKHIQSQLNGFVSQAESALRAAGFLRAQWSLLSSDLDQVIADLDKDPGSLGLVAMLNTARGDWENALDLARRMQPRGDIPVQDVDNMMDVIHTGKKPQRAP